MSPRFAVADTCFLIDWARYRRREILFRLFDTIFVPEDVLDEAKSERVIVWISGGLRKDNLSLYTPDHEEVEEAHNLIEKSRLHPQLPSIDLPEALCLVVGRRRNYVVLTENRGALFVPRFLDDYRGVRVWRSLEVIVNAAVSGLVDVDCDRPEGLFDEYSEDTLHLFPKRSLKRAVEEVRKICERS